MLGSTNNIFEYSIRILVIILLLISILIYPKSSRWSVFIIVVSLLILVLFSSVTYPHKLNKTGKRRQNKKLKSSQYHSKYIIDDSSTAHIEQYDSTISHEKYHNNFENSHHKKDKGNNEEEGSSYMISDATGYY